MERYEILEILKRYLGDYKEAPSNNSQLTFYCVNCRHRKKKLSINLDNFCYHCWVCDIKGNNFVNLLKKYCKIDKLTLDLVKNYTSESNILPNNVNNEEFYLPKEFISLNNKNNSKEYIKVIKYLNNRNIFENDILKYNIGYCEEGEYIGRVIIPSYDERGVLNYFVSRTYLDNYFKYKNPSISKDVIFFEFFINWNYPIVLCEGVFDAISIRRNVIPLLGKNLSKKLKLKIIEKNVSNIYLCLDIDAKKDSLRLANEIFMLNNNINVYIVDIKEKDPSSIGFNNMNKIIYNSNKLNFYDFIKRKLYE